MAAAADRRRVQDEALRDKENQAEARRQETMKAIKQRSLAEANKLEVLRSRKKTLQEEETFQTNIFVKNRGKVINRLGFDIDDLPEGTKSEVCKVIMSTSVSEKSASPKLIC